MPKSQSARNHVTTIEGGFRHSKLRETGTMVLCRDGFGTSPASTFVTQTYLSGRARSILIAGGIDRAHCQGTGWLAAKGIQIGSSAIAQIESADRFVRDFEIVGIAAALRVALTRLFSEE